MPKKEVIQVTGIEGESGPIPRPSARPACYLYRVSQVLTLPPERRLARHLIRRHGRRSRISIRYCAPEAADSTW